MRMIPANAVSLIVSAAFLLGIILGMILKTLVDRVNGKKE